MWKITKCFLKNGKKLGVSFLYPAGYANPMWIFETLKLQTVWTILIPKSTAVMPQSYIFNVTFLP